MAPDHLNENYRPLALVAAILGSLGLFAVFFLGFLVAPLAVLAIFYVIFAASDRSKRSSPPAPAQAPEVVGEPDETTVGRGRLEREAALRRAEIERQDEGRSTAATARAPQSELR